MLDRCLTAVCASGGRHTRWVCKHDGGARRRVPGLHGSPSWLGLQPRCGVIQTLAQRRVTRCQGVYPRVQVCGCTFTSSCHSLHFGARCRKFAAQRGLGPPELSNRVGESMQLIAELHGPWWHGRISATGGQRPTQRMQS